MPFLDTFEKDPQAKLDYVIDWQANGYLDPGESIVDSTFFLPVIPDPADLIKGDPHDETFTATTSTVWLSGGTANREYRVRCRIVTSKDRTDERSITIRVVDR